MAAAAGGPIRYRPIPLDSMAPAIDRRRASPPRTRASDQHRRHRLARGAAGARLSARRLRVGLGAGTAASCGARWAAVAGAQDAHPGREHHHPAAGQEPLSVALPQSAPQAQGGGDGLPAGAGACRRTGSSSSISTWRSWATGIWGVEAASRRYYRRGRAAAHRDSGRRARRDAAVSARLQPGVPAGPDADAAGASSCGGCRASGSRCRRFRRSRFRSRATAINGRRGWIRCSTRCGRRWKRFAGPRGAGGSVISVSPPAAAASPASDSSPGRSSPPARRSPRARGP